MRANRPIHLLLSLPLLVLAAPGAALDQTDRIELAEWLTADDRPGLEEVEVIYGGVRARMFEAQSELDVAQADFAMVSEPLEEAEAELEAAETALREAVQFDAGPDEIADLEDEVYAAQEWVEEVGLELEPYTEVLEEARARREALEEEHRAARRVWVDAKREVTATQRLVDGLDEKKAEALHAAMKDAAEREVLPLDIDVAVLEDIAERDLGERAIAELPAAYESVKASGGDGRIEFLCRIGDAECPDESRHTAGADAPSGEEVEDADPASALDVR